MCVCISVSACMYVCLHAWVCVFVCVYERETEFMLMVLAEELHSEAGDVWKRVSGECAGMLSVRVYVCECVFV